MPSCLKSKGHLLPPPPLAKGNLSYTFILRSPYQTVNQSLRSYKNDQSNILLTGIGYTLRI